MTLLSCKRIEQAVVIPVLAERASLFRTLATISRNPPSELGKTLVLCVVNNHGDHLSSKRDILDNQETLKILKFLISGQVPSRIHPEIIPADLREIAGSNIRLACIDASSPGMEIPDREGGVGTARKIGMDMALQLLNGVGPGGGVIMCLDADTLVANNYISAICDHFAATGDAGAVVDFAHQMPLNPDLLSAICSYEIFLRSYVMGLSFAGSPYAFHSIGSAMACTAEGYASVRGMNRREAAEDFHFLNKLAKIGNIGIISNTRVFPSPRGSHRVPFGTGQQINRFLITGRDMCVLHDPNVFVILRKWLECIEENPDGNPEEILKTAGQIHPGVAEFLCMNRFENDWMGIRRNCPDSIHLIEQFHVWFDGLMTLRLIHHLSRSSFPPVGMIDGIKGLLDLTQEKIPSIANPMTGIPEMSIRLQILEELRFRFSPRAKNGSHTP